MPYDPNVHTSPPHIPRYCCDGECDQGRDCPYPDDDAMTGLGYAVVTGVGVWILVGFLAWALWSWL